MNGYIYFAQAASGGPIKVGYSQDPVARLRSLNTSSPQRLRLIAMFPATSADERYFHDELAAHCLNGEWFEDCEDVRAVATLDACIQRVIGEELQRVVAESVAEEQTA